MSVTSSLFLFHPLLSDNRKKSLRNKIGNIQARGLPSIVRDRDTQGEVGPQAKRVKHTHPGSDKYRIEISRYATEDHHVTEDNKRVVAREKHEMEDRRICDRVKDGNEKDCRIAKDKKEAENTIGANECQIQLTDRLAVSKSSSRSPISAVHSGERLKDPSDFLKPDIPEQRPESSPSTVPVNIACHPQSLEVNQAKPIWFTILIPSIAIPSGLSEVPEH
jgi:hypothetical protein